MITESLLNVIMFLPLQLLSLVSPITSSIKVPSDVLVGFSNMLGGVAYVFPVVACMPIFISKQSMKMFRIAWAFIIRIKSFIPTMGA